MIQDKVRSQRELEQAHPRRPSRLLAVLKCKDAQTAGRAQRALKLWQELSEIHQFLP